MHAAICRPVTAVKCDAELVRNAAAVAALDFQLASDLQYVDVNVFVAVVFI